MIRRIIWSLCRFIYIHLVKPFLFLLPPDNVHESMIKFSAVVGDVPFLRKFVSLIFKRKPNSLLSQNYHGIDFYNPVGISAGFDKNGEIITAISALGFGFGEVGSVTARRCTGNPRPWFYRLPKTQSVVVNAGLANEGSKIVIDRINRVSQNLIADFPIILSVAKTNDSMVVDEMSGIVDYTESIKRAKNIQNISIIELNISCPNAYGGEPFTDPGSLDRLLSSIDKIGIKKPIYIKMPIDLSWPKFKKLLDVAVSHQIAGVTISNLMKNRKKVEILDSLTDTIKGNLSGKPTSAPSNELIRQTYLNYGDKLIIIGVGGIFSAHDAYEKIKLGASLIEVITGVLFNGPQLAAEINDGIALFLKKDGFTNINQAIGAGVKTLYKS